MSEVENGRCMVLYVARKVDIYIRSRLTDDDWRFRKSDAEMFFRLLRGHARATLERIVWVCNQGYGVRNC